MRRPLRHAIALGSLAIAMAVLLCIDAFANSYRQSMSRELDHSGAQMMLVPIGCPYDAAARVLKNRALDSSLPVSALDTTRNDPDVALAAPLLVAAAPRKREHRVDVWVGIDESAMRLKPWWKMKAGSSWFADTNSVICGSEAAVIEMREPGDKFLNPETGWSFRVGGVLQRSGTSDDAVFFVPLKTAQAMFKQPGRITAIAIQLKDPAKLRQASERLQKIPGAQVVTMTEVMGALLNLIGTMRALVRAVAIISLTVCALTVFNTVLAGVLERAGELSIMRALGASRAQIMGLLTMETLSLATLGSLLGLALALAAGPLVGTATTRFVSFVDPSAPLSFGLESVVRNFLIIAFIGGGSALYPAWRAARVPPADATRLQ